VEDSLAELILEDRLKEGDSVMFDVENGNIEAKVLK
jgi:cold shock CspA family protein